METTAMPLALRSTIHAVVPEDTAMDALLDRIANAIRAVVEDAGGTIDVLRVSHLLDPHWRWPDDPVPNRA
jgi:hypothetical protein